MICFCHSRLAYWVVDPSVKHHTTTHNAITCCLLCSLVYSIIYLLNDLFISCLTDLRSCGSICEAPHHHTLCYNLLLPLLTRPFHYLCNQWPIYAILEWLIELWIHLSSTTPPHTMLSLVASSAHSSILLFTYLMIYLFHSWLTYGVVDPSVKHHTTTHYAITCCFRCSLVYSISYLIDDLFISFLTGLLSCDPFLKHHTTPHYAITCCLLCSLVYSIIYLLNDLFISFLIAWSSNLCYSFSGRLWTRAEPLMWRSLVRNCFLVHRKWPTPSGSLFFT